MNPATIFMKDSEFEFIRDLVYKRSRISLGDDKRELVSARLGKRLRATEIPSLADYCTLLKSSGGEAEISDLIDAISTNHTFFFRETAHFDFLRDKAAPEMAARARAERWARFNVWSAACSSGEEAYSTAMTLDSCMGNWAWHIECTDISHRILAKAQAAIYRDDVVGKLPADVVRAHFQKGIGPQAGNYRVKAELRDHVTFRHLNLLEGEPAFKEPFHVIFCRNVMIYFDRPTQEELVARLTRRLVPGGYLFVGHAESLTNIKHSLTLIKPAIYQKPFGS